MWKLFFSFKEALKRTIYTKFPGKQNKELIYKNMSKYLEPELLPSREDFFGEPDAKYYLNRINNSKQGKKHLFFRMDLISWMNKEFSEEQ